MTTVSSYPRIKKSYSIVVHDPDTVELRFGVWNVHSHLLKDESKNSKLFQLLLALSEGVSIPEIVQKYEVPRSEIEGLIDQLTQLGVIEHSPTSIFDLYLEQISPLHRRSGAGKEKIKPILLLGDHQLSREIARNLDADLQKSKVEIVDPKTLLDLSNRWMENGLEFEKKLLEFESWKDHFIVLAQEYIDPLLGYALGRITHALNIPWLNVSIDGPCLFIGPTFQGSEGPCYNCFETKVLMNLKEQENYRKFKISLANEKVKFGASPLFSSLISLASSLASFEIINFSLTGCSFTKRKVLSIYLPTMEIVFNDLLQLSSCEICSNPFQDIKGELYFNVQSLLRQDS